MIPPLRYGILEAKVVYYAAFTGLSRDNSWKTARQKHRYF